MVDLSATETEGDTIHSVDEAAEREDVGRKDGKDRKDCGAPRGAPVEQVRVAGQRDVLRNLQVHDAAAAGRLAAAAVTAQEPAREPAF
jgi:hypothetical protein